MEDFDSLVEVAKNIEKSALSKLEFAGKVTVSKGLDLNPADFEDMGYHDMLNLYERNEKILKASRMEIFGAPKIGVAVKEKAEEVETKMKEISTRSLEQVEELSEEMKKPIETKPEVLEKPEAKQVIEEFPSIEFERLEEKPEMEEEKKAEEIKKEIEFEEMKKPEFEIEKEVREEKAVRKSILPQEEKAIPSEVPLPRVLQQAADKAAEEKLSELEEHIRREWGETPDHVVIKKKMLELTKELFKEKVTSRREKIKLEIAVLKNLLLSPPSGVPKGKKAAPAPETYAQSLFDTLLSTQQTELVASKDNFISTFNVQIDSTRKKFINALESIEGDDSTGRSAAYEKFVFELTALHGKLEGTISKQREFLLQKHKTELEKLPSTDKRIAKKATARISELEEFYMNEFSSARDIVSKHIKTMIETSARMVKPSLKFAVPLEEEEKVKEKEIPLAEIADIIDEINSTDEGSLLYYLHSKVPDLYKKYERKHLSKQEALQVAKIEMAKEKGLSDGIITKYFGKISGYEG